MARRIPREKFAQAKKLRVEQQLSTPEIARRVGLCNHSVYRILKNHPWLPQWPTPRGGKRVTWSREDTATLVKLWPTAEREDLIAAFPKRNWDTISRKACDLSLSRISKARRTNKRMVHPIIKQLCQARQQRRIKLAVLAKMAGHHPVEMHEWELGKKMPKFLALIDVANALGFDLVLKPRMASVENALAPISKDRLMGGRA